MCEFENIVAMVDYWRTKLLNILLVFNQLIIRLILHSNTLCYIFYLFLFLSFILLFSKGPGTSSWEVFQLWHGWIKGSFISDVSLYQLVSGSGSNLSRQTGFGSREVWKTGSWYKCFSLLPLRWYLYFLYTANKCLNAFKGAQCTFAGISEIDNRYPRILPLMHR